MRALLGCFGLVLAVGCAPAAAQSGVNAPPGNAAVDQYVETIPSLSGNQRPSAPRGGSGQGARVGAELPPATKTALRGSGPIGGAVEQFVASTSSDSAPLSAVAAKRFDEASKGGSGAVPVVLDRYLTGGSGSAGGMGPVLPVLLGMIALGGIAISLTRRQEPG